MLASIPHTPGVLIDGPAVEWSIPPNTPQRCKAALIKTEPNGAQQMSSRNMGQNEI